MPGNPLEYQEYGDEQNKSPAHTEYKSNGEDGK
jgi:hypothetical protein